MSFNGPVLIIPDAVGGAVLQAGAPCFVHRDRDITASQPQLRDLLCIVHGTFACSQSSQVSRSQ